MAEIKYEIKEKFGTLSSQPPKGWSKELNLVSWNGKGITLTVEDLKSLREILNGMEL